MIKLYKIKVGEKTYEVELESISEKEGTIAPSEKVITSRTPMPEGEKVEAPMQGLIVAIPVTLGQKVQAGDTLVVVEAMKMENPIVSPISGIVTSILVSKGATVDGGDVLVTVA